MREDLGREVLVVLYEGVRESYGDGGWTLLRDEGPSFTKVGSKGRMFEGPAKDAICDYRSVKSLTDVTVRMISVHDMMKANTYEASKHARHLRHRSHGPPITKPPISIQHSPPYTMLPLSEF